MKAWHSIALAASAALLLGACAATGGGRAQLLIDGARGLDNFDRSGDAANWAAVDGAVQATAGGKNPGYLVTRQAYRDMRIVAEVWVSDDANSGIFFRCQNPRQITDESCYEANLFDQRPDPTYATGAIVKVAAVAQPAPKAGGKWNTLEVLARGSNLQVRLNGQTTVNVNDAKLASGPIALQWGRGVVKFRKVEITPL